ncbi:MAG: 2-amino-4-hydroxy-6-hydroxymethyldihydropteridine diphosphokinase [Actinomycetales bacterium]|jgi:2-amino-4-hydroxy-6-hydroxymethyldihydropteridine diphosphokinase|nr:2-amino-4-hydroxy-6-hydroxymethyldihydropteridine diphosphokinase [Actinomycetales bacterium]
MKAVIALGANLGDPKRQISEAIDQIRDQIKVTSVSKLIETEPVGVADKQPNYINAVLIGESDLRPLDLMKVLSDIENKMGRFRSFPNAARTIDIDIIDYGGLFMESPELTLPHPRAHLRRFVLAPWLEIEPDGELSGHGPIRQLLANLEAK